MSRAFVKESDGDENEALPDRPVSEHPNFVTPTGLRQIKEKIKTLEAERLELKANPENLDARGRLPLVEQDLRYFQQRLRSAVEIDAATLPPGKVQFGSMVEFEDETSKRYRYRIVGEDEADAANGSISWVSPLAKALMGHEVDDEVEWQRPNGSLTITVLRISTD